MKWVQSKWFQFDCLPWSQSNWSACFSESFVIFRSMTFRKPTEKESNFLSFARSVARSLISSSCSISQANRRINDENQLQKQFPTEQSHTHSNELEIKSIIRRLGMFRCRVNVFKIYNNNHRADFWVPLNATCHFPCAFNINFIGSWIVRGNKIKM